MAAALTLLLVGSLLQGALCGKFKVSVPQTIEVLRGSCVTIPCSFDVEDQYESNLDNTCKAVWRISGEPQTSTINGELTGDLTQNDCTTTLNNMQPANSKTYFFRLECDNRLKYNFEDYEISISVKDDPPRPTLTPSELKVIEGTSVNLTCSAPVPCLSHPPTLTWTPNLGDSVETLQENQDKTKVKTSVVNFTASQLHHGKTISCTATYNKQDGSTESAVSFTADISYSPKRTTVSVSPSGPVTEGSNVTLTCNSPANPAVKNYTWYRADGGQETFVWTGAVLNIKASKDNSPFFCKAENSIGVGRSNLSQIDVQFAPQILSSSDCIKAADHLNCSCRTVGNPSPTLLWYLDGSPVNHSDKFVISNEPLTGLWSIITVNGPRERDLSNLLCRSSNSLGSATQRFCVNSLELQTSAESQGRVTLTFFIVTVGVLTAALICALLFIIRAQRTVCRNSTKSQCTGDTSSAVMSQGLTGDKGNKASIAPEEDIYVNANMMRKLNVPNTHLGHQQVACQSSEKKNEEGSDVVYSSVIWKSKCKTKKGERSGGRNPSSRSYLEEERCMEGGVSRNHVRNALEMEIIYDKIVTGKDAKKTVCTEYAQVNFRDQNIMQQ